MGEVSFDSKPKLLYCKFLNERRLFPHSCFFIIFIFCVNILQCTCIHIFTIIEGLIYHGYYGKIMAEGIIVGGTKGYTEVTERYPFIKWWEKLMKKKRAREQQQQQQKNKENLKAK